jgi:hypothetical protein
MPAQDRQRKKGQEKATYDAYEVAGLLHISQVHVAYLCRTHQIGSRNRLSDAEVTQLRELLKGRQKAKG